MGRVQGLQSAETPRRTAYLVFNQSPFWIQAHGLPPNQVNEKNAHMIGDLFEEMTQINIRPGGGARMANGDMQWISFKYERLPDFCFKCGIIGHTNHSCNLKQALELQKKVHYGTHLKAATQEKEIRK
ncbi:conserved hypothetical protein [Ricinus communis]|uniref:CCHC-type domain-containing protein n=1 Tax=Ricinus communis TaxID=3988 RepID=B9RVF4_RICCO|nr:conserved hypothetical protein [Ricinus communis]